MPASASRTVPALSDAMRHVEISGVFYCPSVLSEPWALTMPPMPGCVWFHAVTSGRCLIVVDEHRAQLDAGDFVLVPHGTGHRIAGTDAAAEAPVVLDVPHEEVSDHYAVLRYGGGGPVTELVCGGLRLDHPIARRVVGSLPPIVHVRASRSRRSAWPHATLDLLADELHRREIAGEAVISRLCDILVLQTIRTWVASDEAATSPWLTAMNDPQIGAALAAMHADPSARWSVASLATVAMMSRSGFAARFTELLGQPAMHYLRELRMQLAADLLRRGELDVASVARRVGYESEASFARAFKRVIGSTPRASRRATDVPLAPAPGRAG